MILPAGAYRYEIRRGGDRIASEETRLGDGTIAGSRRSADGLTRYELDAAIDAEGLVRRVSVRYASSLFKRNVTYEADGEMLRGSVSALAGRNEVVIKLGRFREIDVAGFVIFRALTIMHMQVRGTARWTGRVAVIDAGTLVAAALKQNCRREDESGRRWLYEPRMGDAEEIELDEAGRIVRRRDNRGVETVLTGVDTAG
jgi:hypothetical protein